MNKKVLRQILIMVTGSLLAISAFGLSDKAHDAMAERLTPAGSVCVEGDACAAAVAATTGGPAKSGKEIYDTSCMACHSTGAAGAPKLGDVAAWEPRIAQGIETVYQHAIGGLNGMPPKGTCMSCSDDEIKATVDYIVEHSK